MAPKGKKGAAAPPEAAAAAAPAAWECPECAQENEAADEACCACDAPRPAAPPAAGEEGGKYAGIVCGLVLTCEAVAGKDTLKELSVDVGAAAPLRIVTSAPNVEAGARVVVATVGAQARVQLPPASPRCVR